jgi:hypothetical protein
MPFAHPIHRTLILVAQPEYMATDDLLIIRDRIRALAPDVQVMVVGRADRADLVDRAWWGRPALTVSFGPVGKFTPLRGKVLFNHPIAKLEQYRMMSAAGISTPRTAAFQFGMSLPELDWGAYCLLKPVNLDVSSSGRGLYLFRTGRLSGLRPQDLPPDHLAVSQPMIVQSFINTGARFRVYRCLTLFGEVIYQNLAEAPDAHPSLDSADGILEAILPEPPRNRTAPKINTEPDVMAFATSIQSAFPATPLLGCDIVRDLPSGKLYAIEVNAGGNVWHLSSPRTRDSRTITKTQSYLKTFNSYDRAALALIRATRKQAG